MTDGGGLEEVRLVRADPAPWGFRLMGGRDYGHQLTVTRVLGCSLAEHAGLKVGDVVMSVNGVSVRSATHMEAQEAIRAAGDSIILGVIRGPIDMPPPLEADVPIIQPPLAHEPTAAPEVPEVTEEGVTEEAADVQQDAEAKGEEEEAEVAAVELTEGAEPDGPEGEDAAGGEAEEDEEEAEDVEEEDEDNEEDEDEEERKARLNKLDGIRPRMARSPGPDDILRMQEKALARMEKARSRKDRPPTVFMLPPDRPLIRKPYQPRVRPPDPPFKKLVQERIRRRKWAEEHPGEEYPFVDEAGRTPTPDSELTTRATMTPTPTFSDGAELSELADQAENDDLTLDADDMGYAGDGGEDEDVVGDGMDVGGRCSSGSRPASRACSRASRASRTTPTAHEEPEEEPEPEEVLTAISVEETEKRLEEVSNQLDALHNLPRSLRPSVEHIKEELQQLVQKLLEQLEELRRRELEERLAEEARLEAERLEAERAAREAAEAAAEAERAAREAEKAALEAAKVATKQQFKTDVPAFIHEMTEKLSLERPSFPLTPLPRPIVLPGGRKWRTVADAFNEDFIAETLTSQAEVLLGHTLGDRRKSNTFPALIHERAEINESCYGCGRINFLKYSHKHDHLKNSAVYRMVHGLDDHPSLPIEVRPGKVQASINDYYEAAARQSVAPSPITELE